MNIDKAKILLDKINVLMRSMAIAPDQIAEIEKDLMKNYIKQLYEIFLHDDGNSTQAAPLPKVAPKPKPAPAPKPEPVVETPPPPPPPPPKPKPKPTPPPPPAPEPEVELEIQQETPPPPPKPKPAPPKPKPKAARLVLDEDMEDIFSVAEATDLSERLSQSPIKDLTKAFSINERLFNVKELFGGDNDAFQATLKDLNGMNSYDEAVRFLVSTAADKYGWTKRNKKKKAKEFAKTVKRRYN